jgi:NADP-dependent 3-hydroxy acid dehydrogenase YdfG
MSIEQKVAVITGASQSIGAALVKAYRDRNYRVVATARSVKPLSDEDVLVVPGDIADRKTAERTIFEGMARFGHVDTLVNNAGIFIAKPFPQYTPVWASRTSLGNVKQGSWQTAPEHCAAVYRR